MALFREITPAAFDPASIDEPTRKLTDMIETALAAAPPIHQQDLDAVRQGREEGKGPFGPLVLSDDAETRTIRGPAGDLGIRIFRAKEPRGVYFHIHGGGWTIGRAHHNDPTHTALVESTGLNVVSVDYRLAPENPYPAAPDDCEAAALWVIENATKELATDTLLIGAESAGAHLAAVTLLRLREKHGASPFVGANLVYGCFDLALTPSVRNWGDRNLILSTPIVEWFAQNFVPEGDRRTPDVSPLYGDLSGMPPALFTVGTLDPLLDDSLFMYGRWLAAGGRAEIALSPGSVHAFNAFPSLAAAEANDTAHDFLRRMTDAAT